MPALGIRRTSQQRGGTGYWPTYATSAGGFYSTPSEARRAASSVPTGFSGWWDRLPLYQKIILITGGAAVGGELAAPLFAGGAGSAAAPSAAGGAVPPLGLPAAGVTEFASAAPAASGGGFSVGKALGWLGRNVSASTTAPQQQQMPDLGHAQLLPPIQPTLANWQPRQATASGIPPDLVLELLRQARGAEIPAYQWGSPWHPGGPAIVGEAGPELVNLPQGASVDPFADIAQPQYYPPEPVQPHGGWERLAAGLGEQPFSASVDLRQPGSGLGLLLAALAGYANYRTARAAGGLKARQTAATEQASVRTKASEERYKSQLSAAEKTAEERNKPSVRTIPAPRGFERLGIESGTLLSPEEASAAYKAVQPSADEWWKLPPSQREMYFSGLRGKARAEAQGKAEGTPQESYDWLGSLVHETPSGSYLDVSTLTGKDKAQGIRWAVAHNSTPTEADESSQLRDIESARKTLDTLRARLASLLPEGAAQRIAQYPGIKLSDLLQTNAQRAAFRTFKLEAARFFRATAGPRALRMSQDLIKEAQRDVIPEITDELQAAYGKLDNAGVLLDNAESPILKRGGKSTDSRPPLDSFWRP